MLRTHEGKYDLKFEHLEQDPTNIKMCNLLAEAYS